MRSSAHLVGVLAAAIPLLAACGHCSDVCEEHTNALASLTSAGQRPADNVAHILVSIREPVLEQGADQLAATLEGRLREAMPNIELPVVGEVSARTGITLLNLNMVENGVRVGFGVDIDVRVPGMSDARIGVTGEMVVDAVFGTAAAGETTLLQVDLSQSRIRRFDLQIVGSAPQAVGPALDRVSAALQGALDQELVRGIGQVTLAEIPPLEIDGSTVSLFVASVRSHPRGDRVSISLQTDLLRPGSVRPARLPRAARQADLAVAVSPDLGAPLLTSVLAVDGGLRFDSQGRVDPDGDYTLTLTSLQPGESDVSFAYRLYHLARPCLIADFSGRARLALDSVEVLEHRLVDASRFRTQVEAAQPTAERLSERLSLLMASAVTEQVVALGPAGSLALRPVALRISDESFVVTWAAR